MWNIVTENLTKKFGSFTAVDRLSIKISKGDIFGFLGANGAGKTTAIRMLCGLLSPTSGTGQVAGFDIRTSGDRIRNKIGYMSQKFSLYGDCSLRQNLELYGALYGLEASSIRKRTDELATFLDMQALLDRRTGELPAGWQQRLSLACAELHEPDILLLDEPTGSVDPLSRKTFWDFIIELASSGKTVLVTTHHLDEAEYCSRISIMVDGIVAACDSPYQLKKQTSASTLNDAFLRIVENNLSKPSPS